jgi:hypothetical protein
VYTQATMNRKPLRGTILFAALTLVSASAAFAQSTPNLSGTWLLNFDKSGERIAGNGADVPFPSQMVIAQSPTELTVERTSVRQDPFKAAYRLDGSRVTVAAPEGISETAEAKFDGATLVIMSRRSFSSPAGDTVIEFREVWTLNGNELSVRKTVTQDGDSDTETAVYDKS